MERVASLTAPSSLTSAATAALSKLFGDRLRQDDESLSTWGRDWTRSFEVAPSAVVFPNNTEEVVALVQAAREHGFALVPSGGRTGLSGGAVAPAGEVVVSFDRMNRILELDAAGQLLRCEAGTITRTIQEHAEAQCLFYPVDFASSGSSQIGGNVATNAGGNRVIRYGMMRENVLGLEAVLADGTVVSSLHPMIKNNTGYDLKQLFIGSEGTLGVVTRVVLRLRQLPRSQNVAFVAVSDFSCLTSLLGRIDSALGGTLSAFEVMWRDYYELVTTAPAENRKPVATEAPYYVLIESLGSEQQADEARFEAALTEMFEAGVISDAAIAKSQAERDAIWAMRDDVAQNARNAPIQAFDVSLRLDDMEAYVAEVNEKLQARWPVATNMVFGHLGDGNLHLITGVGDGSAEARHGVEAIIYGCLRPRGGSISAEHGIGTEKKPWLSVSRSDAELALMRTLKQALDPKGILNPGKIF